MAFYRNEKPRTREDLERSNIEFDDQLDNFDRYAFYNERIQKGVNKPKRPEPAENPIKVLILCGGYGEQYVADIADAVRHQTEPNAKMERYLMLLRGAAGREYVSPGLLTVNGETIMDYWTYKLDKVDRVAPVEDNMYIVVNDIEEPRYTGYGGWIDDLQDNPPFKHDHVLKNNSNSLEDWGGDVADIKHALRQIGTDNHVLIIDANLLMYPTYNLQRLVEHCYTRAKNTIAYTTMTQTDMRLFGMDPQTVITLGGNKNGMLVPPIDTIELDAQAHEGSLVAEAFLFLRKESLQHVLEAKADTVQGLAKELHDVYKHPLCAVDMGWGRFRLNKLQELDYADNFFYHRFFAASRIKQYEARTQNLDSCVTFGDDVSPIGPPRLVDRKHIAGVLGERMDKADHGFDDVYLTRREMLKAGFKHVPLHKTPPMFYESTIQRQHQGKQDPYPVKEPLRATLPRPAEMPGLRTGYSRTWNEKYDRIDATGV